MTKQTKSLMAIAAAIVLIGAGIVRAKSHDGSGHGHGNGHGVHGHGGPHGNSGNHGGSNGGGNAGPSGNGGHGNGGKGNGGGHGAGGSCDAASSVIGAFVDATCPCAGVDDGNGGTIAWKNHGQYVRCVAHAVKDAFRSAGVKRRCARDVVPCAAQSSCGKKNAVTCIVTTTGTCTNGVCDGTDATPCAADADCGGQTCGVTSADRCAAAGGTAASGSCCSASPSGAFLD